MNAGCDYRRDIIDSAIAYTEAASGGYLVPLDIEVLRSATSGRVRVEIILTSGGPTISVVVDSSYGEDVIFLHSQGYDPRTGDDLSCIRLGGSDSDVWRRIAAEYAGELL